MLSVWFIVFQSAVSHSYHLICCVLFPWALSFCALQYSLQIIEVSLSLKDCALVLLLKFSLVSLLNSSRSLLLSLIPCLAFRKHFLSTRCLQQILSACTNSKSQPSNPLSADDIKPCPRCGAYIIKMNDGSCNHMTCAVCGCEFCWLCMKEISDLHYLRYLLPPIWGNFSNYLLESENNNIPCLLSPSGCTFWGKKPWSRKKKILWQLGTLIGAPVGITLIAGIAVPAMVIGIPVYIGRKVRNANITPFPKPLKFRLI